MKWCPSKERVPFFRLLPTFRGARPGLATPPIDLLQEPSNMHPVNYTISVSRSDYLHVRRRVGEIDRSKDGRRRIVVCIDGTMETEDGNFAIQISIYIFSS